MPDLWQVLKDLKTAVNDYAERGVIDVANQVLAKYGITDEDLKIDG